MQIKTPGKDISYADALVDVLYLFNQSEEHIGYCLFEFNAYAIYPMLHGKMRMFYDGNKPIGLVTWAFLSNDKAEQFSEDAYMLDEVDYVPEDGDQLWGIEYIAPFGNVRQIMKSMKQVYYDLYDKPKRSVHWKRLTTGKQCRGTF
jgi:hemolysin-activating ACP:hemolysin acyltransferase